MYQSGRAGDEAKKRKSPAKSGRVGITALVSIWVARKGSIPSFSVYIVKLTAEWAG